VVALKRNLANIGSLQTLKTFRYIQLLQNKQTSKQTNKLVSSLFSADASVTREMAKTLRSKPSLVATDDSPPSSNGGKWLSLKKHEKEELDSILDGVVKNDDAIP
jgi:hypothetical protein